MALPHWLVAVFALLILMVGGPAAHASYPVFWSFKQPSPNGKYAFVHIGEAERSSVGGIPEPAEARQIRSAYPRSGLYLNDGSTVPLWTLDSSRLHSEVRVASDGIHVVLCLMQTTSPDDVGMRFLAEGKVLRTYRVGELLDDWDATEPFPGFGKERTPGLTQVYWVRTAELDDATLHFTLVTADGNRFVFDARTGEMLSASRPARIWRWLFRGAIAIVGLLLAVRAVRWIVRPRKPQPAYPVHPSQPLPNPWEVSG